MAVLGLICLGVGMLLGALWFSGPKPSPQAASSPRVVQLAPPQTKPESRELHGDRTIEGSVRDDRGQPLEGAVVRITSLDEPARLPREARTDGQGGFRIGDLPRHAFTIEVSSVGHDGIERVVRAADQHPLTFVLPRQGELLVVLRDTPGMLVTDAEVTVTGTGLWPAARCRANAQGECLFESLPGGQYRARARHGDRIGMPSAPITVMPGQRGRVDLTLEAGSALRGSVVERSTRLPLVGARVSVLDLTPGLEPLSTATDATGKFELTGLWPGPVRLEVTHDGYAPHGRDVELPFTGAVSLELDGAASLVGRVVDERGNPVVKALLSVATREGLPALALAPAAREPTGELGVTNGPVPKIPLAADYGFALGALAAESGADGTFRISGLEPGPLVLRASHPGFAPAVLNLEDLSPHVERTDVRVVLREAGEIRGRILDARGRGVGGVYVAAYDHDAPEQSALTDERGDFALRDLLGELTVRAQPEGHTPLTCSVTVTARSVMRCDLTIGSELYDLSVRVVDQYGVGLAGAVVTVRAGPTKRAYTQVSQRDGTLMLHELPEPPYALGVQLAGYLSVESESVDDPEQEVRITMQPAASLSGTVLDASGRVVPHAFVSTDEGDATTETDEGGSFFLESVAPGPLTVWSAHPEAGEGRSDEVRARAGETLPNVRIVLSGRYGASGEEPNAKPSISVPREPRAATAVPAERAKPGDCTLEQRADRVVVASVSDKGPAAKAGLRAGDILASIDGEQVLSSAHARGMLRDPPNTTAAVRVLRNRQPINLRYRRPPL